MSDSLWPFGRQLVYYITLLPLCQGVFQNFFWVFSTLTWALLLLYALADSFVIISLLLHFVNTFFSLFSRFFIFSFAKLLIAKATLLLCCRKDFALSDWLYRLRSKAATTRGCAPHLHSKCKRLRRRLLVNLRSRWSLTIWFTSSSPIWTD